MRYRIKALNRDTGEPVDLTVEAQSEDEAIKKAGDFGAVVESIRADPKSSPPQAPIAPQAGQASASAGFGASTGLGIAALILGIVGLLGAWIPFVGCFAIPVGGIGLIVGAIGAAIAFSKRDNIGMPVAGMIVSILAVGISVSMTIIAAAGMGSATEWLIEGADTGGISATDAASASAVWQSGDEPVQHGDIEVEIWDVVVGRVQYEGGSQSSEDQLTIRLDIRNTSKRHKIDYKPWSGLGGAMLTDDSDNTYGRKMGRVPGQARGTKSLYPDASINDVLVFERPIAAVQTLKLVLSAKNIGGTGRILIAIPRDMINE